MEVILLEKIRNLGDLGKKVKVKAGFARNFLLPQKKAIPANEANLHKFEERRAELEKRAAETLAEAKQRAEKGEAIGAITIGAKASEEGKLYGSVGIAEVAEALEKAGLKAEKSEIKLPVSAIRHTGEYEIHLYFHSDVSITVKVNVIPE